jgi:hypothetical protein
VKALSVRQPWANAILLGKDVENRDWPEDYGPRIWLERELRARGSVRVLLHAGKGCTKSEYEDAVDFIETSSGLVVPPLAELPRGAIVGAVTITGWVDEHESPWFVGPGALTLDNAVALPEHVPCKGALGFFAVPAEVAAEVRRQAAASKVSA